MPKDTRMTTVRRLTDKDICLDPTAQNHARLYLEDYAVAVRMLRLCREDAREREQVALDCRLDPARCGEVGGDEAYWLARMREIRAFIDAIPPRDCKLLMYYHYIRGLTVERSAEELDVSVRTAFRLKSRAIGVAAKQLQERMVG